MVCNVRAPYHKLLHVQTPGQEYKNGFITQKSNQNLSLHLFCTERATNVSLQLATRTKVSRICRETYSTRSSRSDKWSNAVWMRQGGPSQIQNEETSRSRCIDMITFTALCLCLMSNPHMSRINTGLMNNSQTNKNGPAHAHTKPAALQL